MTNDKWSSSGQQVQVDHHLILFCRKQRGSCVSHYKEQRLFISKAHHFSANQHAGPHSPTHSLTPPLPLYFYFYHLNQMWQIYMLAVSRRTIHIVFVFVFVFGAYHSNHLAAQLDAPAEVRFVTTSTISRWCQNFTKLLPNLPNFSHSFLAILYIIHNLSISSTRRG